MKFQKYRSLSFPLTHMFQSLLDDSYYTESFENILIAWTDIIQDQTPGSDLLRASATRIFNEYLCVHLSPPQGSRTHTDDTEEIEDNEDNDRIRYDEQLETIGSFGRLVLDHSLPVLYRLLESGTEQLSRHLQAMQTRAMCVSDARQLDALFEDLHWTILVAGHVLCMNSEGETAMMLAEVTRHSLRQSESGESSLEATLRCMADVMKVGVVAVDEKCDAVLRVVCAVLRLCEMEKSAAHVKLGQFMSPELGCTMMWFLRRFCLSYVLPVEMFYEEVGLVGSVCNFILKQLSRLSCDCR